MCFNHVIIVADFVNQQNDYDDQKARDNSKQKSGFLIKVNLHGLNIAKKKKNGPVRIAASRAVLPSIFKKL